MTHNVRDVAIGVFSDREQAEKAVDELRRAGFRDEQITVTAPGDAPPGEVTEPGVGIGLLSGAAIGGLAGGPVGLLGGAAVGSLLGWLLELGVPELDAAFYRDRAEAGETVVAVWTSDRLAEAQEILRRLGAQEAPPAPAGVT